MTIWWRLAVITTALALSACDQPTNPINTADAPDMVLLGGKVLTVDANNATAEAIAITGNRISAVGGTTEIRALVGENTSIVELDGRTVIPGLTDSHIHVIRAGLTWAQEISWADIPTLDEALGRVRNAAASTPDGEWLIVAGGWHKFQFVEKRLPSAAEVSEAAGNHPIYVQYLYDTAKNYNSFYNQCPILKAENEDIIGLRLTLTQVTVKMLQTCGKLLGMRMPDKM